MEKKTEKTYNGKTLTGKVISCAMQKTVIVEVTYTKKHPLYKKAMKKTRHFACHCEHEAVVKGNTVLIKEIKPMSKTKFFEVTDIVR